MPPFVLVASFVLVGCGGAPPAVVPARDFDNLSQIGSAYSDFIAKKGKPPAGEKDLRPFLQERGDPDALLRSPEDGQPYVILWGVDYRALPIKRMPPPIIAYQKDGKDGRRFALTVMGVAPFTDAEFQAADFIAAKPK